MAGFQIEAAAICYHLGESTREGRVVRKILSKRNVRIIDAGEKDLGQKIGYLAGLPGFEKEDDQPEEIPEGPFLLMCFFPKELFDGFLSDLRTEGVYIPLKGMLTPTNVNWRLGGLIAEISREHDLMMKQHSGK